LPQLGGARFAAVSDVAVLIGWPYGFAWKLDMQEAPLKAVPLGSPSLRVRLRSRMRSFSDNTWSNTLHYDEYS
jgi:hypothetical protein